MGNLLDSLFPEGGWLAKAQRAYTGLGGTPDEVLGSRPEAREELSVPRGELLSPLASRLAALKSGRDPVGNALLNFAGPIKAYHGSPHLFDKFSMKNVGTGEGAQAYGHGLYFAENEGVARSYRDALSNFRTGPEAAKAYLDAAGGNVAQAIAKMRDHVVNGGVGGSAAEMQAIRQGLDLLQRGGDLSALKSPGSMYEVSLRTAPERLLDWDKPLSAQPQIVEALVNSRSKYAREIVADPNIFAPSRTSYGVDIGPLTGQDIYKRLSYALSGRPGSSKSNNPLLNAGIDGIQYLDAGSRAAGAGSRNYVMFDDKLIDILKRYGLGGATIGAGNALIPGEQ